MKKRHKIIFTLFLFMFAAISFAQQNSSWIPHNIVISGAFLTGPCAGFAQIPAGGTVGTSSPREPTFSSLGITYNNNFDAELDVNWQNFTLYGGYQYIRPHGTTTLNTSIITHGTFIPAGSNISTDLKFDWYRLGGKYAFYLAQNKLILAPLADMIILDFDYRIPNFIAPRHFKSISARVGLYGAYYFKPQFFIAADLATSIPVLNLNLVTATAKLNYTFFAKTHIAPTLFVGGQYIYLDLEDQQSYPNHMRYSQPSILAGLSVRISL